MKQVEGPDSSVLTWLRENLSVKSSTALPWKHFFLLLLVAPCRVDAFADYLLNGGGCWTELSPEEVIMNHAVIDHVEGENLRIIVGGYKVNDQDQITLPRLPQTVQVSVAGSNSIKDYQYVIDVIEADSQQDAGDTGKEVMAAFDKGSCSRKRRISGRANDPPTSLVIHRTGARIVAGWATGHEAVKLTPTVTFVSPVGVPEAGRKEAVKGAIKMPDWTSALVLSCPEVVEAHSIGEYKVVYSPVKLAATRTTSENEIQLQWPSNTPRPQKLVLVSSSTDATFPGGVCGGLASAEHSGPRRVLTAADNSAISIPVLTVHQPHTVKVYAFMYDAASSSIRRTDPFVLRWVPDDAQKRKEAPKATDGADPQRVADAKVLADPQLLHKQAEAYRKKDRVEGVDRGRGSPVRADDRDEHQHHRDTLSQEEGVVEGDDAASAEHRRDMIEDAADHQRGKTHGRRDHVHHALHHVLLHYDPPTATVAVDFTLGTSYYMGIAILIVSPILVVQFCLRSSRKVKGRRTL
jgi:hypothetical protein